MTTTQHNDQSPSVAAARCLGCHEPAPEGRTFCGRDCIEAWERREWPGSVAVVDRWLAKVADDPAAIIRAAHPA